jgi:hypothetical protein
MALQNNDLFYVQRGGQSYNVTTDTIAEFVNDSTFQMPEAPKDNNNYGRANGAWKAIVHTPPGIGEAPSDNKQYVRKQAQWAEIVFPDSGGGGGGDGMPAGTKMLFVQASPPEGWSIDNSNQGNAIRIRSNVGEFVPIGNADGVSAENIFKDHVIDFSNTTQGSTVSVSANTGNTNGSITVDGTSLSEGQLASHTHSVPSGKIASAAGFQSGSNFNLEGQNTGGAGSGSQHNHSGSFAGHTHTQTASTAMHDHGITGSTTLNLKVRYTNTCIGIKA